MNQIARTLTGIERTFAEDDIIVSKTDPKGKLTYVNDVFISISGYVESELIGQPHSMIRHPEMPRAIFKLLWDTIAGGHELFAYVLNRCKNGDHYWVFAHVTPTIDPSGTIIGFHSNRRVPKKSSLDKIKPLYAQILAEEKKYGDRKQGLDASWKLLQDTIRKQGMPYEKLIFAL